jgi:hypothetical protein
VVSSDGHRGAEWRPVGALADGVAAPDELVGPERALWMARDAPAAIIAGQPIPTPPVVVQPARRVFRRRGRGVAGGVGKEPEHAPTIRPAPALPPGPVVLPAQEAGEERPRSERLRYLVLIPLLAVAVVSFVFVRLKQGEGQPLIVAQRHAQTLTPSAVASVVRVAPDPVIRRAGVAARCASSGSGVLRNPWRCRIRYPSGRVIGYRVTINADGSYVGNDELVRYHGRQFHDTGTIGGCCISIP